MRTQSASCKAICTRIVNSARFPSALPVGRQLFQRITRPLLLLLQLLFEFVQFDEIFVTEIEHRLQAALLVGKVEDGGFEFFHPARWRDIRRDGGCSSAVRLDAAAKPWKPSEADWRQPKPAAAARTPAKSTSFSAAISRSPSSNKISAAIIIHSLRLSNADSPAFSR